MLRFHLDAHVAHAVANALRARSIDATTTTDAALEDASDLAHIAYARAQSRVIYTQDRDFLRLHREGVAHAGIVYSKQGARSIGEIVRFLELMSDCLDVDDMAGQVEFL